MPVPSIRFITVLTIFVCSLPWQNAWSEAATASERAALYGEQTTYSIFRKGKKIGSHQLQFNTAGADIEVSVESRIRVTVLKVPVYKLHYLSTEKWQGNQLQTVESSTTINKTTELASLQNSQTGSQLMGSEGNSTNELLRYASNHWNVGVVDQSIMFNTIKGVASNVAITKEGTETLQLGEQEFSATRYLISGDIEAQSWYEESGRWVKLQFEGNDGSQITYLIDNID